MKYIALLRGINVGGNKPVDMLSLRNLAESLGYTDVATYINSGNLFFSSAKSQKAVYKELTGAFLESFGFDIATLIKTQKQIGAIAAAIPAEWQNDDMQKTDVAYLFDEIDSPAIIDQLPWKKEYLRVIYTKGALIWNVLRTDQMKSNLSKLASHKLYQYMTVRNVNTARFLADPRF